ncbi:hypothetical protein AB0E63_18920 [Kribbella sp. NPDC026596]|uniref:hypothetical protein n=1 Tax=Kribbella sp. NPDC026596 TaxID=3155122 RepID=UPI00340CBB85
MSTYGEVSRRLRDLLGVGPGPELQRLHAELLVTTDSLVVPRQLPTAIPAFSGRTEHLRQLESLLPGANLGLIIGPAGVGKTSLAIHWSRAVAESFPDNILYADLLVVLPAASARARRAVTPAVAASWSGAHGRRRGRIGRGAGARCADDARRLDTADSLTALADVQERAGQDGEAWVSWTEALEILEALDHPDAEVVRRRLDQNG